MGLPCRALFAGRRKPSVAAVVVEIDGQRVVDGSTISAAGTLIITTPFDTALFVDGVAWQPIDTIGNSKVYVVASGGRFVVYDLQGRLLFTFINEYTQDFELVGFQRCTFYNSEGSIINRESAEQTYVQTTARTAGASILVEIEGNYTDTPAATATPSYNQGEVSMTVTASKISLTANYDPTKYAQVKLGNVLIAFITAL